MIRGNPEVVPVRYSAEKAILKSFAKENSCTIVSFLVKLYARDACVF